MPKHYALEIKSPEIAEIAIAIDPTIEELDYDTDLHQSFLVFGFPQAGAVAVVPPETFHRYFDHIENGTQITLKHFVKN